MIHQQRVHLWIVRRNGRVKLVIVRQMARDRIAVNNDILNLAVLGSVKEVAIGDGLVMLATHALADQRP